jgi:uncharacterized protein YuzE
MRVAYYDRDADIAWFPTGESDDVVSERVPDGVHDYDKGTRRLVAVEIWDASTRLPIALLEALSAPEQRGDAPAQAASRSLPEPLRLAGDPRALSRALEDIRGYH